MLGHQNDCVPNNVISPFQPKRAKRTNLGAKTKDRENGGCWEVQFNSVLQLNVSAMTPGKKKPYLYLLQLEISQLIHSKGFKCSMKERYRMEPL